jgi:glycosyltransferase involved in cell wall biosynthesis
MRILHAPSNIANQAWSVAQGLRALGHHAEVWHRGESKYGFPADRMLSTDDVFGPFLDALNSNFDVLHFHFGRSLVRGYPALPLLWDVPAWRALGKKVVFTFHGSDIRVRSEHMANDEWSYFRFSDVGCDEERIATELAIARTYADRLIVAGRPLLSFVPDAVYVPKALHLPDYPFAGPRRERTPLVVHVPSKRATKGTDFVLKGIAALEERGVDLEFKLAEDLPHDQLVALYADADVIVDNLLLGDCEVSSLEAMALGKPAVTRIVPEVLEAHPDLPVVNADPDSFVAAIEPVLRDAALRRELGERGRAFVEKTHASDVVARRLVDIYSEPVRRSGGMYPEWASLGIARKAEGYEEKIRALGARVADQKRKLEEKDALITKLRTANAVLEKAIKPMRAIKRVLGGGGKK